MLSVESSFKKFEYKIFQVFCCLFVNIFVKTEEHRSGEQAVFRKDGSTVQ